MPARLGLKAAGKARQFSASAFEIWSLSRAGRPGPAQARLRLKPRLFLFFFMQLVIIFFDFSALSLRLSNLSTNWSLSSSIDESVNGCVLPVELVVDMGVSGGGVMTGEPSAAVCADISAWIRRPLLRLQQQHGVMQWQVGLCYPDLLSTVLVLTAEVLAMPQLTCLVWDLLIKQKERKKQIFIIKKNHETETSGCYTGVSSHKKPSAWAAASGFWDMKLEPWAVRGLSDGLWRLGLLSAQLGRLQAWYLSRHITNRYFGSTPIQDD